jgi:hypothetical protein
MLDSDSVLRTPDSRSGPFGTARWAQGYLSICSLARGLCRGGESPTGVKALVPRGGSSQIGKGNG